MQFQTLLVSVFLGLAVAAPQDIAFPQEPQDGEKTCQYGTAIPGPKGTFCISTKGFNFGAPGCKFPTCNKMGGCGWHLGADNCLECDCE
ncbi:hypothetical protein ISF_08496 [Cordyceps fumosorosea ARSEF 2679]|uniref:Uncharacterized protein n=1 Tax=Cordyceps fumosorosea (strain ARSEF 2679) TaxID=1081104 RepID=A0A167M6Z1_CORFA|nr:hypothetical protein ISF_08496 [Cordyceps fumosorosea ARSEF 2679]OAA54016.1 hypothetical protein ISF_08496 [Cordyceps fumosorosea ARSEF 2679]